MTQSSHDKCYDSLHDSKFIWSKLHMIQVKCYDSLHDPNFTWHRSNVMILYMTRSSYDPNFTWHRSNIMILYTTRSSNDPNFMTQIKCYDSLHDPNFLWYRSYKRTNSRLWNHLDHCCRAFLIIIPHSFFEESWIMLIHKEKAINLCRNVVLAAACCPASGLWQPANVIFTLWITVKMNDLSADVVLIINLTHLWRKTTLITADLVCLICKSTTPIAFTDSTIIWMRWATWFSIYHINDKSSSQDTKSNFLMYTAILYTWELSACREQKALATILMI